MPEPLRSFEILPWDSAFFGVKIGRISLKGPASKSPVSDELGEAIREADQDGVECLYWLVDSADSFSSREAGQFGFRLVDIRITFEQALRVRAAETEGLPAVRAFRPQDLPRILELARNSHRDSRFFHDGNIAEKQCEALFEEWLRKSCQGESDTVFVAEPDNQAAGYCVCSTSAEGLGSIALIAVDPRWRRARVGTALVAHAMEYFRGAGMKAATVVTQGRNIASQGLYQRSGFVTKSVQLWYHRWRSDHTGSRP